MIVSNPDDWADRCRFTGLHGISHNACNRYNAEGSWYYEVVAPGLKHNLTDIAVRFVPLHLHAYNREVCAYTPQDFAVAYREYQRLVSLPICSRMSDQDVQDIFRFSSRASCRSLPCAIAMS